jgi:Fic-DOC domain mobile mystery protein B
VAFGEPISGQTPIDDISGLRNRGIATQAQLNVAEAENVRKAVVRYLAARPSRRLARFDLPWLKVLHTNMFGEVWTWAGTFRRRELTIGSPPHTIETDLQALLDDLVAWSASDMPLLEEAVRLHHRALLIHPFLNGNGRWGRLLSNIWLKREGGGIVRWPDSTIGAESTIRGEYLAALRAADAGDIEPFRTLHERYADVQP